MQDIWQKVNKDIDQILQNYRRVAVVGVSDKPYRPSYDITRYLLNRGFTVFPVNPKLDKVLDVPCYPSLKAVPGPIEIVNIFRRPEFVLPIVEEAIEVGARVIWMQLGVANEEAARLALDAGLQVVMDACIKVELAYRGI
ncbi:CoA-binding protein [Calditrichota bacterium LG25]